MIQELVHSKIVKHCSRVEEWFRSHRQELDIPFYSSYDIRDSSFKVSAVDANIYPAGFNNICPTDKEHTGDLVKFYINRHYGPKVKRILILTEEHTNNPYYWENVRALKQIMLDADLEVRIAIPRVQSQEAIVMKTSSGEEVRAYSAVITDGRISVKDYEPDLVVSNNDFSEFYAEWGNEIVNPMNPPRELGWYQRKKSTYFKFYNQLATDFARVIEIDPWLLTVETELFSHFDLSDDQLRDQLADRVGQMLARLQKTYSGRGIQEKPVLFVKNNSGTYGLGVMRVESAEEVKSLNYKTRKKMKAAKGGRDVEEVIIQEGIPSITRDEGITAEPAIYLIGCQLAGGFLRTHKEKGPTENLNSPGAVYKRLCVSDLKVSVEGHPMENVYGWVAKLGLLAIGQEAAEMKVQFKNYTRWQPGWTYSS